MTTDENDLELDDPAGEGPRKPQDSVPSPTPSPESPDSGDIGLEMDLEQESEGSAKPKPADMPNPVEAALEENKKLKDQLLRALADAENTRRRAERDRDDAMKYSISNFARHLVTVADNLRRAIAAVSDDLKSADPRIENLMTGVEAIERDLLAAFERVGIRKITALGHPFNANQHEVMFEGPSAGAIPGTVIQVVEEGYTIHDRLLRPARVGVAKAADGGGPSHTVDTQA